MTRVIKATVTVEPMKMKSVQVPYPEHVNEGDFVAKLLMCGICGTDHHIWVGNFPNTF